ncbi:MAG: GNAT family protein [Bacteroidia bacterium]
MKLLANKDISLRALEPNDIDVLYNWENNIENWQVSNVQTPFSRYTLQQYIETAHQDIYSVKQLRLIIELSLSADDKKITIGCIDLFDFDPKHLRAGIGILIAEKTERRKGYASDALALLINYAFEILNLHQLYCNITAENEASILLFQKYDFQISGIKKQWIRDKNIFKDELFLQLVNNRELNK